MSPRKRLRVAQPRTRNEPVPVERRRHAVPLSLANPATAPFVDYASRLAEVLKNADWSRVALLAEDLRRLWSEGRSLFICGNGGSAGNAIHLANDFLFGVARETGLGMRVQALSANSSVLTCLANDLGYDKIFSSQLAVQGRPGDVLLVFSGSGNSPNIIEALKQANAMGIKSYAVLAYSGGQCRQLANVAIHFPVADMQIGEDLQLIIGHMLMQWLAAHPAPAP
jgi:D-sedoheptulose 7-phosphate isomerase